MNTKMERFLKKVKKLKIKIMRLNKLKILKRETEKEKRIKKMK